MQYLTSRARCDLQHRLIRLKVHENDSNSIRVTGRKTQGVNLFTLGEDEKVVSVDRVKEDTDEDETEENI